MTRTRWLLACAALLLSGSAWAQEPSPARDCRTPTFIYSQPCSYPTPSPETSCPAQAAETARAPYYYELPRLLFPIKAPALSPTSNPVVWARLFEAVARNHAACVAGCCEDSSAPRNQARRESRNRHMASELLKLYRVFYREGHYRAAEIVANKALELDPENVAAEHALTLVRLVQAAAHDERSRDGAEECDVNNDAPRPGCGMCRSVQDEVKKACPTKAKAKCACEDECKCCQDPSSCKCGENCPCKKPAPPQRVGRVGNEIAPRIIQYCVPGPNGTVMVVEMDVSSLPPNAIAAPVPNMMPGCCPCMPAPCCIQVPPGAMPCQVAVPEAVPMPTLDAPGPRVVMTATTPPNRKHTSTRIDVRDNQVHVRVPSLEACADSVRSTADGRAVFKGNACVSFHGENQPARILADCIVVNLEDGSYEVNPQRSGAQVLNRIGAKVFVKKYLKVIAPVQPASCVCPEPSGRGPDPFPVPPCDEK